jgi:hypothetical protein
MLIKRATNCDTAKTNQKGKGEKVYQEIFQGIGKRTPGLDITMAG